MLEILLYRPDAVILLDEDMGIGDIRGLKGLTSKKFASKT
jgi:hypothetical protein